MRSIISVSSAMARQQRPWSTTSSSSRRLCLLPTTTSSSKQQAASWRGNTIVRTLVVGQPTKIQYMPIQTIDVRGVLVLVVIVYVCLCVLFVDFNTIISTRVCHI